MPKKKKPGKFSATKAVKSLSRAVLGPPPSVKRLESKKRVKKEKHKASVAKLMIGE